MQTMPKQPVFEVPTTEVVAAVLTHGGRLCLCQRSKNVTGDVGLWHCITGFLSPDGDPRNQATTEISEEAGIPQQELELRGSAVVEKRGRDGQVWKIHAYHFSSATDLIKLNWENDASSWLFLSQIEAFPTVDWFTDIVTALSTSLYEDLHLSPPY